MIGKWFFLLPIFLFIFCQLKFYTNEDMKVKVLIPYLESLGYSKEEFRYEHPIEVHIGTKKQLSFLTLRL